MAVNMFLNLWNLLQSAVAQVSCPAGNFNGQELAAPSLRLFGKQWVNTTGTFSCGVCVSVWSGRFDERIRVT
jgi:hypothetical protein